MSKSTPLIVKLLTNFVSVLLISVLVVVGYAYFEVLRVANITLINSNISVIEDIVVSTIEQSLRYGKSLKNYYSMPLLFQTIKESYSNVDNVSLVSKEGDLYATLRTSDSNVITKFYKDTMSASNVVNLTTATIKVDNNGAYHEIIPVHKDNNAVGYVDTILNTKELVSQDYKLKNGIVLAFFLTVLIFVAIKAITSHVFYKKVSIAGTEASVVFKLKILRDIVLLQVLFLCISLFIIFSTLSKNYIDNAQSVANLVRINVESVISKGANYTDLGGLQQWLSELRYDSKAISSIKISVNSDQYTMNSIKDPNDGVIYLRLLQDSLYSKAELIVNVSYKGIYLIFLILALISSVVVVLTGLLVSVVFKLFESKISIFFQKILIPRIR